MESEEEGLNEEIEIAAANGQARRAIRLWSSVYDAFFQDFQQKGLDNDRLGSVIAAARLAQLSSYCMAEFHGMAEGWVESPTEARAATEASENVVKMMDRQLALIFPVRNQAVLDTTPRDEPLQ
jgi:hypothetical protein